VWGGGGGGGGGIGGTSQKLNESVCMASSKPVQWVAVDDNIQKAFFALGSMGQFYGNSEGLM